MINATADRPVILTPELIAAAARPLLVDVRGVAALLGISAASVYRAISAGDFPKGEPFPGTNRILWRRDVVEAWIDQHFPREVT